MVANGSLVLACNSVGVGSESGAINLNDKETADFERRVRDFAKLLSRLKLDEHGWQFVSVAAGYIVKAFFAQ